MEIEIKLSFLIKIFKRTATEGLLCYEFMTSLVRCIDIGICLLQLM